MNFNKIYKSILALGLIGLVSMNAMAQRADSTLTRQVLLERDYNPTLNEATKINTAPNIFSPRIQPASGVKFIDQVPQLNIGATKIGQVASGDIKTEVPFSKERFYLNIGAGSYANIDGAIGVRAVDTKNDKLDIFASHSAMSGKVKYAHSRNLLKDVKAKFADTKANVKYKHSFAPSILSVGASYENMGYNYYGNPLSSFATLDLIDLKTKQKVDIISVNAGLKSSDANEGVLKYEGRVAYTNFKSKYGFMPAMDKGPRGGIIEADVNFYTALGVGDIGIKGGILNQSYDDIKYEGTINKWDDDYTNLIVNPYYRMGDVNWDVTLGANINYVMYEKNKFAIAPNITAQIHINEVNTLYASATGGVNNNTYLDILQENRYVSPGGVMYSRTAFDIQGGFKSGIVPNLEFDIFAGYKQVKDDHVYAALSIIDNSGAGTLMWGNVGTPLYSEISTGHFGGLLKTKLIPKTTLTAKLVGYFYNVKDLDKAWGRPSFTAELNADVKPIDKLTVSLSYLLMAGRKGFSANYTTGGLWTGEGLLEIIPPASVEQNTVNMKNISELNIRAEYEIVKWISIHARVNNILNQKYEQHLGYTHLGMNILGGFNFKF